MATQGKEQAQRKEKRGVCPSLPRQTRITTSSTQQKTKPISSDHHQKTVPRYLKPTASSGGETSSSSQTKINKQSSASSANNAAERPVLSRRRSFDKPPSPVRLQKTLSPNLIPAGDQKTLRSKITPSIKTQVEKPPKSQRNDTGKSLSSMATPSRPGIGLTKKGTAPISSASYRKPKDIDNNNMKVNSMPKAEVILVKESDHESININADTHEVSLPSADISAVDVEESHEERGHVIVEADCHHHHQSPDDDKKDDEKNHDDDDDDQDLSSRLLPLAESDQEVAEEEEAETEVIVEESSTHHQMGQDQHINGEQSTDDNNIDDHKEDQDQNSGENQELKEGETETKTEEAVESDQKEEAQEDKKQEEKEKEEEEEIFLKPTEIMEKIEGLSPSKEATGALPRQVVRGGTRGLSKKDMAAASAYNDVIEETASKLISEKKRNKVKALVGAFETVISLQEE